MKEGICLIKNTNNQLCSNEFINFINKLSNIYTFSIEQFQDAISEIADLLNIGRIEGNLYIMTVNEEAFLKPDVDRQIYYVNPMGYSNTGIYKKDVTTADHNIIKYDIFPKRDTSFSEETIPALEMIVNSLQVSVGRLKLFDVAQHNMYTDQNTGLKNINYFVKYGSELLEKGRLSNYCCFFFKIKNFSVANKKLNFANGNQLMAEYAKTLLSHLCYDEILVNVSGNRYCALVRKENSESFKELLRGTYVTLANESVKHKYKLSSVAGIYIIPDDIENISYVLDAVKNVFDIVHSETSADDFVYFDDKINLALKERNYYSSIFESALEENQFHVFYQPKVALDSHTVSGAEALSRWIIDGQIISPVKFIPVLEQEANKICQLDFYVLEQVCKDIVSWIERGIQPVRVSVNFSKAHLYYPDFVEQISNIIKKYNVDPKYIEIELTESIRSEDVETLKNVIADLHSHDLKAAIDDFGTGYASLSLLKDIDVDILKIDKCFLDNVDDNHNKDKVLFKHIINIANDLGMEIVSEGVETTLQEEFLKSINCNTAQGFLFDKPLPKKEFEQRLINNTYNKE